MSVHCLSAACLSVANKVLQVGQGDRHRPHTEISGNFRFVHPTPRNPLPFKPLFAGVIRPLGNGHRDKIKMFSVSVNLSRVDPSVNWLFTAKHCVL